MFVIDEEIKVEYLTRIKATMMKRSFMLVEATLRKVDLYEEKSGVSVLQMNEVYVEDMLKTFDSSSANSLVVMFNIIKNYVFDYVATTKNDCIGFSTFDNMNMEQIAKCVSKNKVNTKYLTYKEYIDIIENETLHSQGRAIFVLIWNGIRGKEYMDLRNIKDKDVDVKNNTIKIDSKTYTFTDKEMTVIEEAMNALDYNTFDQEGNLLVSKPIDKDNEFLLKKAASKVNRNDEPISETLIKVRIKNIADQLGINATGLSIEISSRAWHIMKKINYDFNIPYADVLRVGHEINQPLATHNIGRIWDIFIKKYKAEMEIETE